MGGLRAIHVPGHCADQLAYLWPEHGGVLVAPDTAANVFGPGLSPMHEDLAEGCRSLAKLAALNFEVACFGHGKVISSGASKKSWGEVARCAEIGDDLEVMPGGGWWFYEEGKGREAKGREAFQRLLTRYVLGAGLPFTRYRGTNLSECFGSL